MLPIVDNNDVIELTPQNKCHKVHTTKLMPQSFDLSSLRS
jgi:hypothetical protein